MQKCLSFFCKGGEVAQAKWARKHLGIPTILDVFPESDMESEEEEEEEEEDEESEEDE